MSASSDTSQYTSTQHSDRLILRVVVQMRLSEREQPVRNLEAERLRGLEINHQLEFGRLHDWQIGGLGSLENLGSVDAGLTITIGDAGCVTHQTADGDELTKKIHRGKRISRGKFHKLFPPTEE